MFKRRSRTSARASQFDRTGKYPVIRASICTGEQVAGFKDETTGKFEELMVEAIHEETGKSSGNIGRQAVRSE